MGEKKEWTKKPSSRRETKINSKLWNYLRLANHGRSFTFKVKKLIY